MPTSSRFAVATQILTVIASSDQPSRSEDLASWANTNPTVVRRLLQMLGRAGLTRSQLGTGGGTLLAREPDKISLSDVYDAVEEPVLFAMPRCEPDPHPKLGCHVGDVVKASAKRAEVAMRNELGKTSIADLLVVEKA